MGYKPVNQHVEWLSLVDTSGAFLSVPVLDKAFPQGLDKVNTPLKKNLRLAYDEWVEAIAEQDVQLNLLHKAWIEQVLYEYLEFDSQVLHDNADGAIAYASIDGVHKFAPDYLLKNPTGEGLKLFISIQAPGTDLEKTNDSWNLSIVERMIKLCQHQEIPVGLITNGEQWMLVHATVGESSAYTSWYSRLWFQEPVTLQAFQSLFGVRRWFGPEEESLPSLLTDSLAHHEDLTHTLGEQVKRSVEVLIQCLDRADEDRNRTLLADVDNSELYNAGLTVMMRLVFILCAEERELLLLNTPLYDENYALSTLRGQLAEDLDKHGAEVLERRHDAWTRILSLFRAIYGGIEHDQLRMAPLGGSLFDPDKFPFLEGRVSGGSWKEEPASPISIDNRTVYLLLQSLQVLEQKSGALLLSYKGLDVEQIGHVYEGLLDYKVKTMDCDTLGIAGAGKTKKPNLSLAELESAKLDGITELTQLLESKTNKSLSSIQKSLGKEVDEPLYLKVVISCNGNEKLAQRVRPFAHFLRLDAWGDFVIYHENSLALTLGDDRSDAGAHYTPKALTEKVVETTLEPVVYQGPSEGVERSQWELITPNEILDLKICDPAMGSGAFLVQVCRYLSERLVESWDVEETKNKFVSAEGIVYEARLDRDPMSASVDERLMIARRLIAEKCLYGVDLNPLAVELAKLSIWLITLAKGRPFGFLDHNMKSGDSLLGIHDIEQLKKLTMHPKESVQISAFADKIENAVNESIELRNELRSINIIDIRDVEHMNQLNKKSVKKIEKIELIADGVIGKLLETKAKRNAFEQSMKTYAGSISNYLDGNDHVGDLIKNRAKQELSIDRQNGDLPRRPFHWAIQFPEVSAQGGFDAIVGNPPFIGGQKITGAMGKVYRDYLVQILAEGNKGSSDLVAYFFNQANRLTSSNGYFGLIAVNTIAEGVTKEIGLESILQSGSTIYHAFPNMVWPGTANVITSNVFVSQSNWGGLKYINEKEVTQISASLTERDNWKPQKLKTNLKLVFQGVITLGDGFVVDKKSAVDWMKNNEKSKGAIFDYLIGKEVNQSPTHTPSRAVISFFDQDISYAKGFEFPFAQVEKLVKPFRQERKSDGSYKLWKPLPERWWQFERRRPALFHKIGRGHHFENHPSDWDPNQPPMARVIVFVCQATKYPCFTLVSNDAIFANSLCVIASQSYALLAYLSTDIHAIWAHENCSRLNDRMRYTHGDIFETQAFPDGVLEDNHPTLAKIGQIFFEKRSEYMIANEKGMTKFYNDIHDPEVETSEIIEMRKLQIEMNQEVMNAYGWSDLSLEENFHEVGYLPEAKNTRFTMSEEAREELLYRLSELNKKRYQAEQSAGPEKSKKKPTKAKNTLNSDDLFGEE